MAIASGRMVCTNEGENCAAGPGDVILLESGKPHTYYATRPTTFTFVHIGGHEAAQLALAIRKKSGLMVHGEHGSQIYQSLLDLMDKLQNESPDEFVTSAMLYSMLMQLMSDAVRGRPDDREAIMAHQIQSYIIDHLS